MPIGVPRVGYRYPGDPYASWVDLYNRLYRERVLFLGSDLDDELGNQLIGVLAYLNLEDPSQQIYLYINSMGGSVASGIGLYDCIQYIDTNVTTICVGLAASISSLVLCGGQKGNRIILPNARVMVHQPSGGIEGQCSEIWIEMKEILRLRLMIGRIYAAQTGQPLAKIAQDLDRDYYMGAQEAKEYGMVDTVISKTTQKAKPR